MTEIKWWQIWRYHELQRRNEENLAALVRERPDFTEADARYFMSLCKSGRRTPDWLVDKMIGAETKGAFGDMTNSVQAEFDEQARINMERMERRVRNLEEQLKAAQDALQEISEKYPAAWPAGEIARAALTFRGETTTAL